MISRNSGKIPRKSRRKITDLRRFQQHFAKISKNYQKFAKFRKKSAIFEFKAVQRYVYLVDLEKCFKNEYLVAKFGLDTAENEPPEKCAFGCCYNNLRPTLYAVAKNRGAPPHLGMWSTGCDLQNLWSSNFKRFVLGCIEADFCNQILFRFRDLQDLQTFAPP